MKPEKGFPIGALGVHTLWDLEGVSPEKLDDLDLIEKVMLMSAQACGATILGHRSQKFQPQGVTVLVLLAESHLAFHSWPERGAAAVDLFSCSSSMNPEEVSKLLEREFLPTHLGKKSVVRGGDSRSDFS